MPWRLQSSSFNHWANPTHSSAETSTIDRLALLKLAEEMRVAGLPALMLIVARTSRHQFHILHHDEPVPTVPPGRRASTTKPLQRLEKQRNDPETVAPTPSRTRNGPRR
jgi:hypothetical protein